MKEEKYRIGVIILSILAVILIGLLIFNIDLSEPFGTRFNFFEPECPEGYEYIGLNRCKPLDKLLLGDSNTPNPNISLKLDKSNKSFINQSFGSKLLIQNKSEGEIIKSIDFLKQNCYIEVQNFNKSQAIERLCINSTGYYYWNQTTNVKILHGTSNKDYTKQEEKQ